MITELGARGTVGVQPTPINQLSPKDLTVVDDTRGHSRNTAQNSAVGNGSAAAVFPSTLTAVAAVAAALSARLQAANAVIFDAVEGVGAYSLFGVRQYKTSS